MSTPPVHHWNQRPPWPSAQPPAQPPVGPPPGERPPSTALLTATWLVSLIAGVAYIGLFTLMALGAADEITTIERVQDLKDSGGPVTNTDEDLAASIAENELAIIVFAVGAVLTIPLLVASVLGRTGRAAARVLATVFLLPPAVVIAFGVVHDINDGHPENAFALVFTLPAIVLSVLWWLPPTTRGMAARRWRRTGSY
ncbi:hypothetical protein [Actinophytocola sediminis]